MNAFTSRHQPLNHIKPTKGPVVYWMIRDQRLHHNWALLYAQHLALKTKSPLHIIVAIRPDLQHTSINTSSLNFMLDGLKQLEIQSKPLHIDFTLQVGDPLSVVSQYANQLQAGLVVVDVAPLRVYRRWHRQLASSIPIAVHQVDAHNIIPVWQTSPKLEYAAYTIRPKIHRLLPQFLIPFPNLQVHPSQPSKTRQTVNWSQVSYSIHTHNRGPAIASCKPGSAAAHDVLDHFITHRLKGYGQLRNNPNLDHTSNLSPYLHFGQISAQYIASQIQQSDAPTADKEAFLEELIVRRELADNYCYYQSNYDNPQGFPRWAQSTLENHQKDPRPFLYTQSQFEAAATHDELWNAAQIQLVNTGKMHGYLRMYWAKKILEWSPTAREAQQIAMYLNDTYSLDGRDPNGYTGIAWSIGGVHDRPWFNRPIFGQVRYMARSGMDKKFDTQAFIDQYH